MVRRTRVSALAGVALLAAALAAGCTPGSSPAPPAFPTAWNDYYGPLLYTSENEDSWTLSLGLASFRSLHHVNWNLVYAATMLSLVPIVVLFFAQKAFVQGVTLTGVKG
jgi:ABC-type maltose transport system permease subunit